ncbi:pyruvate kinase [Sulfuracidifex tepidarius]|uniref:Pyruvate kinase n=1 Tax=Sulfuracidifex tepidarius TaxID=1294262 RepID=A0A510DVE0_9CREN|nr:pyruvate kinase [Sulfuracidifex tepidarius]BBG24139.1 Pyruvate kinase [Sulfuracidifex tepidarius]BBG26896.1 Pyruvate kinase [Sulfuracidifex tepidarius]
MVGIFVSDVRTKIVVTLGPSSIDKARELSRYANVFRFNFAHGDEDSHAEYFQKVRETKVPILVDLPGPKLRIGDLKSRVVLKKGDKVTFSQIDGIPVEDPLFYEAVQEGHDVLLADGTIKVRILTVEKDRVEGEVIEGGVLTSRKGINIPEARLKAGLTENDIKLMKEAIDLGSDFIGLSFVLGPEDVKRAKEIVGEKSWIVSKIEKKEAVSRITEIVSFTDAVMVARGDLGVEIGLENLPIVQRKIVRISRNAGKPVILATQVLESMVNSPVPTRAEVIDVANSIVEGVDAIMLSDETAAGNFPLESVKYLHDTIMAVEPHVRAKRPKGDNEDDAIAIAGVKAAYLSSAEAIAVHSRSGASVVRVSRMRPRQRILGLCPDEKMARKLALCWGVSPFVVKKVDNLNEIVKIVEETTLKLGLKGKVVILGGDPTQEEGKTNFLMIRG